MKKNLILFGGNRKNENGPLLSTALVGLQKKFNVLILTDTNHLNLNTSDGKKFREMLDKTDGIRWQELKKLNLEQLQKFVTQDSIGISLNSVWFFKQDVIDLFNGYLFNYHNTLLPKFRGAAAYTWQILSKQKVGGLTIHKIEEKLDVGNIVKQKKIIFPKKCRIPSDYYKFISKIEPKFFMEFFDQIKNGKMHFKKQDEKQSTYWPKLQTPINGFLNWQWNTNDIELFIRAFDDPYQGASTFIDGKKVRLKKCSIKKEGSFHPFQVGIIFRIVSDKLFVATVDGVLIIKDVFDAKGNKINSSMKLGHRFFTPYKYLEQSFTIRPSLKK